MAAPAATRQSGMPPGEPRVPTRLLELVHRQGVQELVRNVDGRPVGLHLLKAAVPRYRHSAPAAGARQWPWVGAKVAVCAAVCTAPAAAAAAASVHAAASTGSRSRSLGRHHPAAMADTSAGVHVLLAVLPFSLPSAARCCCVCRCSGGSALAAQRLPLHAPEMWRYLHHAHAQRLRGQGLT